MATARSTSLPGILDDINTVKTQEDHGFTATRDKLSKIGEVLQMKKKPQLENLAASVGEYCGNKQGRLCWKARGPALDAYRKLCPQVLKHLNGYKDEVDGSDLVTFMVYMIGKSEIAARPVIMFACPKKGPRKTAMERIRKSGIIQLWMDVGHWDFPPDIPFPHQLGATNTEKSSTETNSTTRKTCQPKAVRVPETVAEPLRLKAIQFLVPDSINSESNVQIATIGALIQTRTRSLYLTANHPFTNTRRPEASSIETTANEEDSECDFGDEESEAGKSSDDDLNPVNMFTEPNVELDNVCEHFEIDARGLDSSNELETSPKELIALSDGSDLTVLSHRHLYRHSADLDYALIQTERQRPAAVSVNGAPIRCSPDGVIMMSLKTVANVPLENIAVVAITKSGGMLNGTLFGIPSHARFLGSKTFQEVFPVKFNGQLKPGDCGSGVMDLKMTKFYGHIVAGSTLANLAYIVPVVNVLRDAGLLTSDPATEPQSMLEKFRQVLSTKRTGQLPRRPKYLPLMSLETSGPTSSSPSSYASRQSLRNFPLIPTPPQDRLSTRFRNLLHTLSEMPMKWQNSGLLDEALQSVPLDRIYEEADLESRTYQALAETSLSPQPLGPSWGHQDHVVKALLGWFKGIFFNWVNNPWCTTCGSTTVGVGMAVPTDDEKAFSASAVELYRCCNSACKSYVRFPRYNDPFVLMRTRKGRVGEWTMCLGMLCRALGFRVRWVWNSEDHCWIEYFSVHQKRWVHVDACEGLHDKPTCYVKSWRRNLAYCIAFSYEGATDVTRRYVRDLHCMAERKHAPEAALLHILEEIRQMRRKNMSPGKRRYLKAEDLREQAELSTGIATELADQLSRSTPGGTHAETASGGPLSITNADRKVDKLGTRWLFEAPNNNGSSLGHTMSARRIHW